MEAGANFDAALREKGGQHLVSITLLLDVLRKKKTP